MRFTILIVVLLIILPAVLGARSKCKKRNLNCKSKGYRVKQGSVMIPGQNPRNALKKCKNSLLLQYSAANRFMIESTFGAFRVKNLCCDVKNIKSVKVEWQFAEKTQFGEAQSEKFVNPPQAKEWNKFCTSVTGALDWVSLIALPVDGEGDNMYLRNCFMKACQPM